MTTIITRQDCLALPYLASSETKAQEFADAFECVYIDDIKAKVFEHGDRWGVAIVEGAENLGDAINDGRIVSLVILLSQFDLTERTGDIDTVGRFVHDIPPIQKDLTRRARCAFRVEDKLDAILTALVGTEGARALELPAGDSHRLPDMPPRMTGTGK